MFCSLIKFALSFQDFYFSSSVIRFLILVENLVSWDSLLLLPSLPDHDQGQFISLIGADSPMKFPVTVLHPVPWNTPYCQQQDFQCLSDIFLLWDDLMTLFMSFLVWLRSTHMSLCVIFSNTQLSTKCSPSYNEPSFCQVELFLDTKRLQRRTKVFRLFIWYAIYLVKRWVGGK